MHYSAVDQLAMLGQVECLGLPDLLPMEMKVVLAQYPDESHQYYWCGTWRPLDNGRMRVTEVTSITPHREFDGTDQRPTDGRDHGS
jgi:hypothetical protein